MNISRIRTIVLFFLTAVGLWGCESQQTYLINDPTVMLRYKQEPSQENLQALANSYTFRVNRAMREGRKPQSGLYAEYAVCMALLGHQEAANEWFRREVELHPYADSCMRQVKYHLIPKQLTDADTLGFQFLPLVEHLGDTLYGTAYYDAGDDETNTKFSDENKMVSKSDKAKAKQQDARAKKKELKRKMKDKKKEQKAKAKAKKQEKKAKAKQKKLNQKALKKAKKEKADYKAEQKKAKAEEKKAIKQAKSQDKQEKAESVNPKKAKKGKHQEQATESND